MIFPTRDFIDIQDLLKLIIIINNSFLKKKTQKIYKLLTIAKKKNKSPILPIKNALNPDFNA